MVEIGAGGGSIARVDDLQRVMVGPDSAGSEPGPACYGRGGENATVTDADVVLGKLRPMGFAGGSFDLDAAQARQAVEAHVGQPLGLDAAGAAFAIAEIVEENMASAARAHASEWGRDLQSRSLVAFGGAAPLHAARLAAKLKIGRVLVPGGAGVGSALGFLLAPVRFEVVRSLYMRLDELRPEVLQDLFSDMREEARAVLRGAGVDGDVSERIQAYMRYVGQGYEVSVEVAEQPSETALRRGFERAYADLYGRIIPGMDVEILSWTLSLTADETQVLGGADREAEAAEDLGTIEMFDGVRAEQVPVRARSQLTMGSALAGPALIVERQTTTVVPSGANLEVLADGTLVISLM
jgi:N-methylhydantoinase A